MYNNIEDKRKDIENYEGRLVPIHNKRNTRKYNKEDFFIIVKTI